MMNKPKAMRDVFLKKIHAEMGKNPSIFFVTADFGSPVLDSILADFPERVVNVGIAEQNLINISTGLALEGFKVYAYAIAPFITMRCYEQIKVNLSLLSELKTMDVSLIGVGAGFSYVVSGPTHHSIEDISIMRTLPNFEIISPSDWVSAEASFEFSLENKKPKYFRFDSQASEALYEEDFKFPASGFKVLSEGGDAVIIATGYMTRHALAVVELLKEHNINLKLIDLFKLKNVDQDLLADELKQYSSIFTLEEAFIKKGGVDSILLNLVNDFGLKAKVTAMGISDEYKFALGSRDELFANYALDKESIVKRIKDKLKQ
jgi:transketolase